MSSMSRRVFVGVAAAALVGATFAPAAEAATDTTNGVYRLWVSGAKINSVNKQLTFAFGPSAGGSSVPAGSTWTVTIQAMAAFSNEGVNLPTTSLANGTGSWSTPRKVSVDGQMTTMEVVWTNKQALSSTIVGPTLQWVSTKNPLRPGSAMLVTTTAPDGSQTTQFITNNQKNGTYYP